MTATPWVVCSEKERKLPREDKACIIVISKLRSAAGRLECAAQGAPIAGRAPLALGVVAKGPRGVHTRGRPAR